MSTDKCRCAGYDVMDRDDSEEKEPKYMYICAVKSKKSIKNHSNKRK